MRNIPLEAWREMTRATASCATPVLMVIDHADLADPIRITDNAVDLTYEGNVYTAWPFKIDLPDETEDSLGEARITISNVHRDIAEVIRGLEASPTISIVAAYWPDVGVADAMVQNAFVLKDVTTTVDTISGTAWQDDGMEDEAGSITVTPQDFPGAF